MRKCLYIIGNGFDLYHDMKTSYAAYRSFLLEKGYDGIVKSFENSLNDDLDRDNISLLWNRMEEVIGLLNYEDAYSYLIDYGNEKWSDSYNHDFQYEIEKKAEYWPGIVDHLTEWIRSIEYTYPTERLQRILTNDSKYISFNYTNTLEKLYDISKRNICYIHGDGSIDNKLILGHRNETYYPEWNDNNPDEDVRLLNAGKFMEDFRKRTYKPIERIISENPLFNELTERDTYTEVYIMGLSYNKTDEEYIKCIAKRQQAHWVLLYYSEDDKRMIPDYVKRVGIEDYSAVTYDGL